MNARKYSLKLADLGRLTLGYTKHDLVKGARMITIILTVLCAIVCFKWGAWRRWREYYPTILYVIIGDMAYNFVFHDHTLWLYDGVFNHTTSDIIAAFLMFPSVVILYLTRWPKRIVTQALYILAWAAFNTLFEYISVVLGVFEYDHGWGILWSFGLLVIAFIMMRLHYRKPLVAWPISAVLALLTALAFGLPIGRLK
jgi:hypothetical protein